MRAFLSALVLLCLCAAARADGITNPVYAVSGSWTPSDTSGAGLTFSNVSAAYTRIGNMVFVYGRLQYPSTADATASQIGGLPFTSANQLYANAACSILAATNLTGVGVLQGSTSLRPFSAGTTRATNAQLTGLLIEFTCAYPLN